MSVNPLAALLANRPFVVLDGGLATELEARGIDLDDPLWSARALLEAPEAIEAVHRAYFEAGADVAITATYQATFEGLARRGLDREAATEVMLRAIALAERARDAVAAAELAAGGAPVRRLVAASVGGWGAARADGSEYRGDYGLSVTELARFHRDRLTLLARHAELVACETIPCLAEARALAEVLGGIPDAAAWVSFTCRDDAHVRTGEPLEACVDAVADLRQVVAVGVNCVAPRYVEALVERIATRTDKPIVAYPNAGEGYDAPTANRAGRWTGTPVPPEGFADAAKAWIAAGARLVGGCCRTGPAHIRALARLAAPRGRGG